MLYPYFHLLLAPEFCDHDTSRFIFTTVANTVRTLSFLTSGTPLHILPVFAYYDVIIVTSHTCTVAHTHRYPQYLHHSSIRAVPVV